MTGYRWVGGGSNKFDNPKDWSPYGVPVNGTDIATVPAGGATMNIAGESWTSTALGLFGPATINLSKGAQLLVNNYYYNVPTTYNLSGTDTLFMTDGLDTVNLANNAHWVGGFVSINGTIDGGKGSELDLSLPSWAPPNSTMNGLAAYVNFNRTLTINVPVGGNGGVWNYGQLTLTAPELTNQMFFIADLARPDLGFPPGKLTIAHASTFAGHADLLGGSIDLNDLAMADSYSYQSDMLSIYSGNTVIDKLNLTDSSLYGFGVVKTGSGVTVQSLAFDGQVLPGQLPQHAIG